MRRMRSAHPQSASLAFSKTVPESGPDLRPQPPHPRRAWPAGVLPSMEQSPDLHRGQLGRGPASRPPRRGRRRRPARGTSWSGRLPGACGSRPPRGHRPPPRRGPASRAWRHSHPPMHPPDRDCRQTKCRVGTWANLCLARLLYRCDANPAQANLAPHWLTVGLSYKRSKVRV